MEFRFSGADSTAKPKIGFAGLTESALSSTQSSMCLARAALGSLWCD